MHALSNCAASWVASFFGLGGSNKTDHLMVCFLFFFLNSPQK